MTAILGPRGGGKSDLINLLAAAGYKSNYKVRNNVFFLVWFNRVH